MAIAAALSVCAVPAVAAAPPTITGAQVRLIGAQALAIGRFLPSTDVQNWILGDGGPTCGQGFGLWGRSGSTASQSAYKIDLHLYTDASCRASYASITGKASALTTSGDTDQRTFTLHITYDGATTHKPVSRFDGTMTWAEDVPGNGTYTVRGGYSGTVTATGSKTATARIGQTCTSVVDATINSAKRNCTLASVQTVSALKASLATVTSLDFKDAQAQATRWQTAPSSNSRLYTGKPGTLGLSLSGSRLSVTGPRKAAGTVSLSAVFPDVTQNVDAGQTWSGTDSQVGKYAFRIAGHGALSTSGHVIASAGSTVATYALSDAGDGTVTYRGGERLRVVHWIALG